MLKIYAFSQKFSAGRLDWGILLVISLEFQGNKVSTVFYDTAYFFNSKGMTSDPPNHGAPQRNT